MAAAGSALHGVLRRTVAAGSREMLLVAAQDEIRAADSADRSSGLLKPSYLPRLFALFLP